MSKELDDQINATVAKLVSASQTKIGYGNYQQVRREYEEVILELAKAIKAINAEEGDK